MGIVYVKSFAFAFLFILQAASGHALPRNQKAEGINLGSIPKSVTHASDLSALDDNDYIIGPGDKFSLKVLDDRTLNSTLEVLNDGSVTIPIIGPVKLTGTTLSQATLLIKKLLSLEH